MKIAKYSANGNDFVIFHSDEKKDRTQLAKELCHRQEGIGADGLIVILPHKTYDFEWQFYNADGSHADMCGNGSRAAAHYAFNNDLAPKEMSFLTGAGVINAQIKENEKKSGIVKSELTPPVIIDKEIIHNNQRWWLLNTGVPHLVSIGENVENFDMFLYVNLDYPHDLSGWNVDKATSWTDFYNLGFFIEPFHIPPKFR